MSSPSAGIDYWDRKWKEGETSFHRNNIHPYMSKHVDKLIPEGKANKIFFPLCGKAVDMKWLADLGYNVCGVDGVPAPLEEFFQDHGLEYVVEDVPTAGENIKLYRSKNGQIRLYCCDIFNFPSEVEGPVDAVWDRGSMEALLRVDVPRYVQVIKSLLHPGSRLLVEHMQYDASKCPDLDGPPFSSTEEEMKGLFEPEYSVENVDQGDWGVGGYTVCANYYLIMKKS